jgi:heme exporter protein D
MSWNSAAEFFAMGGYAFYVWGAYAVTALCIGVELWWLLHRARTLTARPGLNAQPPARQT